MEPGSSLAPLRVLVLGAQPPPLGGATVSLQQLVEGLEKRSDVVVRTVNTADFGGGSAGPLALLRLAWRVLRDSLRSDVVSVHASVSRKGVPMLGTLAYLCARLTGRPFVLRKFGGAHYDAVGGLRAVISRYLARHCDLYLPETKALAERARQDGVEQIRWFPTGRPTDSTGEALNRSPRCRRFVFIGQIRPTKGIDELVEAAGRLPEDVSVDLYGPLLSPYTEESVRSWSTVHYRGVLDREHVNSTLASYDALVLPTYFQGEGYPGVVFEAFALGLPVIATRWMALPELVDDECGILAEPRDVDSLADAMRRLAEDDVLYANLCKGSERMRQLFSSERWEARFVEFARSTVERDRRHLPLGGLLRPRRRPAWPEPTAPAAKLLASPEGADHAVETRASV